MTAPDPGRPRLAAAGRLEPWALALVCGALYAFCAPRFPFGFTDEGYLYAVAAAFGRGALPYADVHLVGYTPGIFYLFAPVATADAHAVAIGRALMAAGLVAKVLLVRACARRLAGPRVGLAAAAVTALVPGPWHKFYVGLLGLALLAAALRCLDRPGRGSFALLGLALGAALLLRIDVAFLAMGFSALVLLLCARAPGVSRRELAVPALVALALMLPLELLLLRQGVLGEHARQWLAFPGHISGRLDHPQRLPPPALAALGDWSRAGADAWVFYGAVALILLAAAWSLARLAARVGRRDRLAAGLTGLWCVASLPPFALERPDVPHLTQYGAAAVMAGVLLAARLRAVAPRPLAVALPGLLALLFVVKHVATGEGGSSGLLRPRAHPVRLSNGFVYPARGDEPYRPLLERILRESDSGARLLALPFLPGVAYATRRPLWGRETFVVPFTFAGAAEERAYAAALADDPPRWLVYDPEFSFDGGPGGRLAGFAPAVAETVERRFRAVAESGSLRLLEPRSAP